MMDEDLREFTLVLGGRSVADVWDRLCRYCGLPWTAGPAETWAYRYFDALETDDARVTPVDVLSTSALHPGLSRADLAFFWEQSDRIAAWLGELPLDVVLRDADDAVLEYLDGLITWEETPALSLLTKVLHRKRPALIPLVDRHILDWYRPVTGERSASTAWPHLLRALRDDLGGQNALLLAMMSVELEKRLTRSLSHLRLVDIIIWMGGRK